MNDQIIAAVAWAAIGALLGAQYMRVRKIREDAVEIDVVRRSSRIVVQALEETIAALLDRIDELKLRDAAPKEPALGDIGPGRVCHHCHGPIAVRNPTGICDHLYYPDNCSVCKAAELEK
jgi:hypothetical protein